MYRWADICDPAHPSQRMLANLRVPEKTVTCRCRTFERKARSLQPLMPLALKQDEGMPSSSRPS